MMRYNIRKCDVQCQKFKGHGPGGQNRNKVETGVRLTHTPTGTKVEVCNERDYTANLDAAWDALQAKLDAQLAEQAAAAKSQRHRDKPDAAFGHHIRSYVLCGQRRVIDHRTGVEGNPDRVLKGDIDRFRRAQNEG
jgi:peptide chain release factor 2